MYTFSLFRLVAEGGLERWLTPSRTYHENWGHVKMTTLDSISMYPRAEGSREVCTRHIRFEISEPDEEEQVCHMFIRETSGLILLDTEEDFPSARLILDYLSSKYNVLAAPVNPPAEAWVGLLRQGTLLRAMVATRSGLEDISQSRSFTWDMLVTHPLVSASISLEFEGSFQVRLGSGIVTVYDESNLRRIGYIAGLLEEHILWRKSVVEPSTGN